MSAELWQGPTTEYRTGRDYAVTSVRTPDGICAFNANAPQELVRAIVLEACAHHVDVEVTVG